MLYKLDSLVSLGEIDLVHRLVWFQVFFTLLRIQLRVVCVFPYVKTCHSIVKSNTKKPTKAKSVHKIGYTDFDKIWLKLSLLNFGDSLSCWRTTRGFLFPQNTHLWWWFQATFQNFRIWFLGWKYVLKCFVFKMYDVKVFKQSPFWKHAEQSPGFWFMGTFVI